jgi:hypothetical protein
MTLDFAKKEAIRRTEVLGTAHFVVRRPYNGNEREYMVGHSRS